jgi:hypothetical protein
MSTRLEPADLRIAIESKNLDDPLVFLNSIMQGHDPRALSQTYQKVLELEQVQNFEEHDPVDLCQELIELIKQDLKFEPVGVRDSINAGKILSEYVHAKRKSVEITEGTSQTNTALVPLSEAEIQEFKEIFNDEF